MDPQANLNEQASLAAELQAIADSATDLPFPPEVQGRIESIAFRLGELVIALIQWQVGGGSQPNLHLAQDVLRHRGIQ